MSSHPDRRQFLAATATGLLASSVIKPLSAGEKSSEQKPQLDSFMKLSLAAYSFNRHLSRGSKKPTASPAMTLADVVRYAASQNIAGVELTGYYFQEPVTDAEINSLKNLCFRSGLDVSGTAIGNDFCVTGDARTQQLKMTRDWIDIAAKLGAPVIRIFAGRVPKGATEAESIARCVDGIKESLEYSAEKGVCLALENHGGITATPDQMMRIIDAVGDSPWFGVNFDSGNFKTKQPYEDLKRIAPLAINAQIKVMIQPEGQPKQKADLERIVEILIAAGYRGYTVLEFEEPNPHEEIPAYLKQLGSLLPTATHG